MEESEFRNKIYWFTFLFSILVVWVHSCNSELFLGAAAAARRLDAIERFLGDAVGQIAVPGFFLISSYLFFRNFHMGKLKEKWRSRIRSVLMPYLVWNTIYYLGYVIASRLPVVTEIVGKGRVPFTWNAAVGAIFHYTHNYVFWYLFQLILLILLAPFIYLLIRRAWLGALVLVVILAAVYLGLSLPLLNLDALFYYSSAAFAAIHGRTFWEGAFNRKRCLFGMFLVLAAVIIRRSDLPGGCLGETAAATVMLRLLSPAALWLMAPEQWLPPAWEWMKNNFFLYAVHFALVRLVNKTAAKLLWPCPVFPLLLYLLMPAIAVCVSYLLGKRLRRASPALWLLLSGGR